MNNIVLIPLCNENLKIALQIQRTIFPTYNAYINYIESIQKITDNQYWLLQYNGEYIGISGLYTYEIDLQSAWLGWFGIVKKFRRKGLGSKALCLFEEEARKRGFKFCRLYTDRFDNDAAKEFYEVNGYTCEPYINPKDPSSFAYPIDIYSKSLDDAQLVLWNNKNINFTAQIQKQEKV